MWLLAFLGSTRSAVSALFSQLLHSDLSGVAATCSYGWLVGNRGRIRSVGASMVELVKADNGSHDLP